MRLPEDELAALEAGGLRRHLRRIESGQGPVVTMDGRRFHNFSSNDYLGLASHPTLTEAFAGALRKHGAGAGASRLICGTLGAHLDFEEKLAAFKRSEAALTFSSGYAAAVGTLSALTGKEDVVILDKLCHASLIDGARLGGATLRVFPHNDLDKLASHLRWAENRVDPARGRVLVVTESVFSMDGDRAPLAEIVALKEARDAWLMVDEAHAFGVIGPRGGGLAAELGLENRIELRMGTLSKAAGLSGGYLCASRATVDLLVNRARGFIYSTAPPPALAEAAGVALDLIAGAEGDARRAALWRNVDAFANSAGVEAASAIVPILLGSNEAALAAAESLNAAGFLAPAIRYPTVPRGGARLRVTLSAAHDPDAVEALAAAIQALG